MKKQILSFLFISVFTSAVQPLQAQQHQRTQHIAHQLTPLWQAHSQDYQFTPEAQIEQNLIPGNSFVQSAHVLLRVIDVLAKRTDPKSTKLLEQIHELYYEIFVKFIAKLHIDLRDKTKILTHLDSLYYFPIRASVPDGQLPFRLPLTRAIIKILRINCSYLSHSKKQERLYFIAGELKRTLLAVNKILKTEKQLPCGIKLQESISDKLISEFTHVLTMFGIDKLPTGTWANRTMFGLKMGVAAVTIVAFGFMIYTLRKMREESNVGESLGESLGPYLVPAAEIASKEVRSGLVEALPAMMRTLKEAGHEINTETVKNLEESRERLRHVNRILDNRHTQDANITFEQLKRFVSVESLTEMKQEAGEEEAKLLSELNLFAETSKQALKDVEDKIDVYSETFAQGLIKGLHKTHGIDHALLDVINGMSGGNASPTPNPEALKWRLVKLAYNWGLKGTLTVMQYFAIIHYLLRVISESGKLPQSVLSWTTSDWSTLHLSTRHSTG